MRQVSQRVVRAFMEERSRTIKSTRTDGQVITLYGHPIAWRGHHGEIYLTLAGYGTLTTRERLNAVCDYLWGKRPYHQHRGVQCFDGIEIDTFDIIEVPAGYTFEQVRALLIFSTSAEYKARHAQVCAPGRAA
jgi:hypothetical protein